MKNTFSEENTRCGQDTTTAFDDSYYIELKVSSNNIFASTFLIGFEKGDCRFLDCTVNEDATLFKCSGTANEIRKKIVLERVADTNDDSSHTEFHSESNSGFPYAAILVPIFLVLIIGVSIGTFIYYKKRGFSCFSKNHETKPLLG